MKKIKIVIEAQVPESSVDELKKLEHHIEYSGILENYPELEYVHCEVSVLQPNDADSEEESK